MRVESKRTGKRDLQAEFLKALSESSRSSFDTTPWEEMLDRSSVIPCGLFEIDEVLFRGMGGFLVGGRYELLGVKGSGKTTLAIKLIGQAQKLFPDKVAVVVDTERAHRKDALMHKLYKTHGVDMSRVVISHPEDGSLDHSYRIMEDVLDMDRGPGVSIVVWDSYGASIPIPMAPQKRKAWNKKEYGAGKGAIAEGARINKLGIARVRDLCFENKVLFLVVNQATTLMLPGGYTKIDSPGGHAFHHTFDVRLRIERKGMIVENKQTVGQNVRAWCLDSRLFASGASTGPQGDCPDINLYFDGRVVDHTENIVLTAIRAGVVRQEGKFFSWGGIDRAPGKAKFIEMLGDRVQELWEETQSYTIEDEDDSEVMVTIPDEEEY